MLKKLSLILVSLLSLSSYVIAEEDWTWIDYEMYCFKNDRSPSYEEFLKISENVYLGDDESIILNLFEEDEKEEEGEE